MTKQDRLNGLYKKYNLTKEDYFSHPQGWTIITRNGIDKIQSEAKIDIKYDVITVSQDFVVIKAIATMGSTVIESFGEADKNSNCRQNYPVAMAEKRGMSRVVLKLTGFYEIGGVFGVDEADDFRKPTSTLKKGRL